VSWLSSHNKPPTTFYQREPHSRVCGFYPFGDYGSSLSYCWELGFLIHSHKRSSVLTNGLLTFTNMLVNSNTLLILLAIVNQNCLLSHPLLSLQHMTVHLPTNANATMMTRLYLGFEPLSVLLMSMRLTSTKVRPTISVPSACTMAPGRQTIVTMSIILNVPKKLRPPLKNATPKPTRNISNKKQLECLLNLLPLLALLQLMWSTLPIILQLNVKTLQSALLTWLSSTTFGCNPTQVAVASKTKLHCTFSADYF